MVRVGVWFCCDEGFGWCCGRGFAFSWRKIPAALRGIRRGSSARRQGSLQARKNTNELNGAQNELYIGVQACRNIATSWQAINFFQSCPKCALAVIFHLSQYCDKQFWGSKIQNFQKISTAKLFLRMSLS